MKTLAAAADPWQPYGKGGKPVVPEAATYGLFFVIATLLITFGRRKFK